MNNFLWTDEQIIQAVKAQGLSRENALKYLYNELDWRGLVIAFVLKKGGNVEDAKDLAQNTFILFERNLRQNKFKGQSTLKTYFMSIAKFQWLKKIRDHKAMDELKPKHYETFGNHVEENFINEEKKKYLEKALGNIGTRCKKILHLWQLNYSSEEIAHYTDLKLSNAAMAKKEAYRCRMRFRNFLEQNPQWKDLIK